MCACAALVHLLVCKAHDDEQDGEHSEPARLDRLSSNAIDGEHADVRSRDLAGNSEDEVTDADVADVLVHCQGTGNRRRRGAEAYGVEDDRSVQT